MNTKFTGIIQAAFEKHIEREFKEITNIMINGKHTVKIEVCGKCHMKMAYHSRTADYIYVCPSKNMIKAIKALQIIHTWAVFREGIAFNREDVLNLVNKTLRLE